MRTTLTLDNDVAAALDRLRGTEDKSLKEIVNDALRRGLQQLAERPKQKKRVRTRSVDLGKCRIGNVDNIAEALAIAEGENFK